MKGIFSLLLIFLLSIPAYSEVKEIKIGKNGEFILNGKPYFPIMVWLQPASLIDKNKQLGIEVFVGQGARGETPKEFLDACLEKGVYGAISIGHNFERTKKIVEEVKDHPALLFWWLPDEPDIYSRKKGKAPKYTAEEIIRVYKFVKQVDKKNHPVALNFGSGIPTGSTPIPLRMYRRYIPGCDFLTCTSSYPVNRGHSDKLNVVGKGIKMLKLFAPDKPAGTWIEISFIGAEHGRKVSPQERCPKPEEVRAEVYMAIVNGATAIGYFPHSWSPRYTQFRVPEDVQREVKKINTEIKELTPVICSENVEGKIEVETELGIKTLVKVYKDYLYIFASNLRNYGGKVKFKILQGVKDKICEVYGENRKIEIKGNSFEDNFRSFQPHIYKVRIK